VAQFHHSVWQLCYRFLGFLLVEAFASAWDHGFALKSKCSVKYVLAYVKVTNGTELKANVMLYPSVKDCIWWDGSCSNLFLLRGEDSIQFDGIDQRDRFALLFNLRIR
jgi:hypothetical protein